MMGRSGEGENRIDEGTVVRLFDSILEHAVAGRASDIHLEPKRDHLAVRFRIDGVLLPQKPLPPELARPLSSRIKVLAAMDISERRRPQDGQFSVELPSEKLNVRCSTFPSVHGEKVVLRLLSHALILTDLGALGIADDQLQTLRRAAGAASGLVIVSGPTGSGKTSTLHSILRRLDHQSLNIMTLEDPIEIRADGLTQGQINQRAGFTFASGLRSMLRQDPDVILVGEMRDPETAQIAFRASLTGHLVFSTLHTSTTIDTITRLLDMGIEPYLVASSLRTVVAQRLVRVLCESCREAYQPDGDLRDVLGFPLPEHDGPLYRAAGCAACAQTGYRRRTGLFEVLAVDTELRTLIKRKSSSDEYKKVLHAMGVPTLRRDGIRKVQQGITTVDEVMRVT